MYKIAIMKIVMLFLININTFSTSKRKKYAILGLLNVYLDDNFFFFNFLTNY